MKYRFLLTGFPLFSFIILNAQSSPNSAGGTLSGNSGNAGYAVGNVFYKELLGTGGSAVPGTQSPFVITSTLGTENSDSIKLEMAVFPNPTTEYLHLQIGLEDANHFKYEIYDARGAILSEKNINTKTTNIAMSNYPSGIYFLSVKGKQKIIKTFKIIKK